eukprot:TRINITY_DN3173_c0_g1_i1.p1 TRINITY_DN3173_c0_g1~~TRINITY_DN3173_c0_g1_i1.p1  ORF type:complete len:578 (+),score=132.52 TRINITY_DN3173_c0_g1_i1:113-1846(+)
MDQVMKLNLHKVEKYTSVLSTPGSQPMPPVSPRISPPSNIEQAFRFMKKHQLAQLNIILNAGVDNLRIAMDEGGTPMLHYAVFCGSIPIVKAVLDCKQCGDINHRDQQGRTPLHVASQEGLHDMLLVLLSEYNAAVNVQDLLHKTPVHAAAEGAYTNCLETLIEHGADINVQSLTGSTPLHSASEASRLNTARMLIKNSAMLNVRDAEGFTPLLISTKRGDAEIVRLFLENGANVHIQDSNGFTPLMHACVEGQEEIVDLLLQYGADPNDRDDNGMSALHCACLNGSVPILDRLLLACTQSEKGAGAAGGAHIVDSSGRNLVFSAASQGNCVCVSDLLKRGVSATATDEFGLNALQIASMNGELGCVDVLLNHKESPIDVNAGDENGLTALHFAAQQGQIEVAQLLLDHGADVTVTTHSGNTPLQLAIEEGHQQLARYLAQHHQLRLLSEQRNPNSDQARSFLSSANEDTTEDTSENSHGESSDEEFSEDDRLRAAARISPQKSAASAKARNVCGADKDKLCSEFRHVESVILQELVPGQTVSNLTRQTVKTLLDRFGELLRDSQCIVEKKEAGQSS